MKREYLGIAMVAFVLGYGLLIYWAAWVDGSALAWLILVLVSVGDRGLLRGRAREAGSTVRDDARARATTR